MPEPAASKSPWSLLHFADPTPVTRPFLAWEKLRIYYNLILLAVALGIASLSPDIFAELPFWVVSIVGALGANVCFCAGPVAENYLALVGANRGIVRAVLFGLGCLFACLLTVLAMLWLQVVLLFGNF